MSSKFFIPVFTLLLPLQGFAGKVTILRDEWGVPRIQGDSLAAVARTALLQYNQCNMRRRSGSAAVRVGCRRRLRRWEQGKVGAGPGRVDEKSLENG